MNPREEARRGLVRQWVARAEKDYDLAQHLVAEGCFYREAVGFNAQQAGDATLADSLREVAALNPCGVEYHYPSDFPDVTQDEAETAARLAEKVRASVVPELAPLLDQ